MSQFFRRLIRLIAVSIKSVHLPLAINQISEAINLQLSPIILMRLA